MTDLRSLMNTFDRNYIVAMFQSQNLQKTYRLSHEKARSKQYCHLRVPMFWVAKTITKMSIWEQLRGMNVQII